jgi:phage-related protein
MGVLVTYFETFRGERPVQEYIESLPFKERIKVKALIYYLSEKVVLNEPHAKKLSGYPGLYELRPGAHRIFYCYHEGKVVLLHAFRKSSNKAPKREIETAYKRMIS